MTGTCRAAARFIPSRPAPLGRGCRRWQALQGNWTVWPTSQCARSTGAPGRNRKPHLISPGDSLSLADQRAGLAPGSVQSGEIRDLAKISQTRPDQRSCKLTQPTEGKSNHGARSEWPQRQDQALYARRGSKRQDPHESVFVRLMRSIGIHRNKGTDCGMAVSLLNC